MASENDDDGIDIVFENIDPKRTFVTSTSTANDISSSRSLKAELIASPYKDGKTNQISLPQAAAATQPPSSSLIQNSSGHVNSSATSARILELEKNLSGARKRLAEAHSQNQEYKQEIDKLKEKVNELDEHAKELKETLNVAKSVCSNSRDELSLAGKQEKDLQEEISKLKAAIFKKDKELEISRDLLVAADERLEKDKNMWFATIERLENKNKLNEERIKRLEEDKSKSIVSETKLKNDVDKLKHLLEEKDKELETARKNHEVVVAEWSRSCQEISKEIFEYKQIIATHNQSKEQDVSSTTSVQVEEMQKNLLAKDEEVKSLKEALRQSDLKKADAWFKREKALVLQLHDSAKPEDARTFEVLLDSFVKQHKLAMEATINLKDWCAQNKVNVIDRPPAEKRTKHA